MDDLELARARRNAARREQYRLDGGKRKAENQAWKESHREEVRAASREYMRQRRLADPNTLREAVRRSYKKHREKRLAANKAWYAAHPGYDNKKQAEYRQKDPVRYMLHSCRSRAKKLGLDFSLTRGDIIIPATCPVLGIPIARGPVGFHPNSPSVDRVDSAKGYVSGNVQVISWRANELKRDGTLAEFKAIVAYMEGA